MKRRVLAILLSGTVVLGSGIMATAATSATVTLKKTERSKTSASVGDSAAVRVYSRNYSTSAHKVKAITYGAVAGGSYVALETKTMEIGSIIDSHDVNGYSSDSSYCLTLNPTAAYKNCAAYGTIKCK